MADNYLEKKMEEHRSRAGAPNIRRSPLGLKPGTAVLAFGVRRIIVTGVAARPDVAEAIVRKLGSTGSLVAFMWDDMNAGRKLAQTTGTRHYPRPDSRVDEVRRELAPIDFEVVVAPETVTVFYDGNRTEIAGWDSSAVAEAVLFALLPAARRLALPRIDS